jgi:hypothetical protein
MEIYILLQLFSIQYCHLNFSCLKNVMSGPPTGDFQDRQKFSVQAILRALLLVRMGGNVILVLKVNKETFTTD